jgi:hypothetical protein
MDLVSQVFSDSRLEPAIFTAWEAALERLRRAASALEQDEPDTDAELRAAHAGVLMLLRNKVGRGVS